jgi:hypothetical protein
MGKLIYPFEKAEYFIQPFLFYQENKYSIIAFIEQYVAIKDYLSSL